MDVLDDLGLDVAELGRDQSLCTPAVRTPGLREDGDGVAGDGDTGDGGVAGDGALAARSATILDLWKP